MELDRRLKEAEMELDRQSKELEIESDRRWEEADLELERQSEEVDRNMKLRFQDMQASRNSLRTKAWEEIYPVRLFDAEGGARIRDRFPRTVKQFWELKDSSQSKSSGNYLTGTPTYEDIECID